MSFRGYSSLNSVGKAKQTKWSAMPIAIVYFSLISPAHPWRELLSLQMEDLVQSGLSSAAEAIYVELSIDGQDELDGTVSKYMFEAAELVHGVLPTARIVTHFDNQFEYPGIHRVWQLGQKLPPSALILYFHGKVGSTGGEVVAGCWVIGWSLCSVEGSDASI